MLVGYIREAIKKIIRQRADVHLDTKNPELMLNHLIFESFALMASLWRFISCPLNSLVPACVDFDTFL